jgi:cardiolipin synthase
VVTSSICWKTGEAFFPRVFECIAAAEREVVLETFIWFDDVGQQLQAALIAAGNAVQIDVTIDDYGSPDLAAAISVGTGRSRGSVCV